MWFNACRQRLEARIQVLQEENNTLAAVVAKATAGGRAVEGELEARLHALREARLAEDGALRQLQEAELQPLRRQLAAVATLLQDRAASASFSSQSPRSSLTASLKKKARRSFGFGELRQRLSSPLKVCVGVCECVRACERRATCISRQLADETILSWPHNASSAPW